MYIQFYMRREPLLPVCQCSACLFSTPASSWGWPFCAFTVFSQGHLHIEWEILNADSIKWQGKWIIFVLITCRMSSGIGVLVIHHLVQPVWSILTLNGHWAAQILLNLNLVLLFLLFTVLRSKRDRNHYYSFIIFVPPYMRYFFTQLHSR